MFSRMLLLATVAALSSAWLGSPTASARTICRPDGCCFNTSGEPIPDQPRYCYGGRHHHHHEEQPYSWRPYDNRYDERDNEGERYDQGDRYDQGQPD